MRMRTLIKDERSRVVEVTWGIGTERTLKVAKRVLGAVLAIALGVVAIGVAEWLGVR